jgi:hypothetical protein
MEDLGEGLERYDTVSYARYFLHCARYFMKDAEKEHSFLARAFPYALSPELSRNFATGEIFAFGRVSLPATLANSKDSPVEEIRMLQIACRIHYGHYGYKHQPDLLNNVIAAYSKEEANLLWPCLARHIAGLASEEERQFLNDLIKYPEHGNPGIADGLKYIVRGDVFFDDGTEATLDDLCAEIGQEPLPYLEPMPVFYH